MYMTKFTNIILDKGDTFILFFKQNIILTNFDLIGIIEKLSPTLFFFIFLSERIGYVSYSYIF